MTTFAVGMVEVDRAPVPLPFHGRATRDGVDEIGHACTAVLSTPDGFEGTVAVISWPSGTVDVRLVDFAKGGDAYRRLERAGGMNIETVDGSWLGLIRALKFGDKDYPTLHQVDWAELDELLGSASEAMLLGHGATALGRFADLKAEASARHANTLAFRTAEGNAETVLAVYALTRVLPILHDFGLAAPKGII